MVACRPRVSTPFPRPSAAAGEDAAAPDAHGSESHRIHDNPHPARGDGKPPRTGLSKSKRGHMAEESQAQAQEAEQETTQTVESTPDATQEAKPTPARTDWKAEARKWEARAKANSKAAEELESANRQAAESKAKADELTRRLGQIEHEREWQSTLGKVSKATGMPVEALGLLKADSEETLAKAAESMRSLITPTPQGMGDQSKEPAARQQSDAAAFLAQVNKNAGY